MSGKWSLPQTIYGFCGTVNLWFLSPQFPSLRLVPQANPVNYISQAPFAPYKLHLPDTLACSQNQMLGDGRRIEGRKKGKPRLSLFSPAPDFFPTPCLSLFLLLSPPPSLFSFLSIPPPADVSRCGCHLCGLSRFMKSLLWLSSTWNLVPVFRKMKT